MNSVQSEQQSMNFILWEFNSNDDNDRVERHNSRFFIISQCHKLSPACTLQWPWRNHVQDIGHMSCAMCCVPHGTKGPIKFKLHLF